MLLLGHTSALRRLESRVYERASYDTTTSVDVCSVPAEKSDTEFSERYIRARARGRIVNLGAGGLAIEFTQPVEPTDLLRTTLDLPGAEPFPVLADIVDVECLPGGRHLVRASFMVRRVGRRHRDGGYTRERAWKPVAGKGSRHVSTTGF